MAHAIEELRQIQALLTPPTTGHPQPVPTLVCQCGTVLLKEMIYPGMTPPACRVTLACHVCTATGGEVALSREET